MSRYVVVEFDDHHGCMEFKQMLGELVRCSECKYAHMTYGGECKYCDKWSLEDSLYLDGDFFCSYGERKVSGKPTQLKGKE